jgi:hypothetical protein
MASVARSVRRRRHIEDWKSLPWRDIERDVFRLQQRSATRFSETITLKRMGDGEQGTMTKGYYGLLVVRTLTTVCTYG